MKKIILHPKMRLALSKSYRYLQNYPATDTAQTAEQRTKLSLFPYPTDFKAEILKRLRKNNNNRPASTSSSPATQEIEKNNDLLAIHQNVAQCQACFLGKSRGNHLALPTQKTPAQTKVVVIVDNVSYYDQMREQYFIDEAGGMIKRILDALKIPMSVVYATAAIKCTQAIEFGDRLAETQPCQTHLHQEIKLLSPELIIAFGETTYQILKQDLQESTEENSAEENLGGKDSGKKDENFEEIRGKSLQFLGKKIIFTYHPRKIMRNPSLKKEVWNNLKHLTASI